MQELKKMSCSSDSREGIYSSPSAKDVTPISTKIQQWLLFSLPKPREYVRWYSLGAMVTLVIYHHSSHRLMSSEWRIYCFLSTWGFFIHLWWMICGIQCIEQTIRLVDKHVISVKLGCILHWKDTRGHSWAALVFDNHCKLQLEVPISENRPSIFPGEKT